jgi:hypothetical protein
MIISSSYRLLLDFSMRRVPSLLLKVDIARAFDSVARPFLLEILEHMGFPSG